MDKGKPLGRTYIREWRRKKGLSLRQLAGRLESEPGVELISFASLGRIENGLQAYTQPILEAIAAEFQILPADLLNVNPEKEGEVVELFRHMDDEMQRRAIRLLHALKDAS